MKYLLWIILFLNCVGLEAKSASSSALTLERKIKMLGVKRKLFYILELDKALHSCPVDSNLVLSIIRVESSFVVDAHNPKSNDYGLMQINEWHVKIKKLNRVRLLRDVQYNIKVGCKILKWFTDNYKLLEAVGRYNAGTARNATRSRAVRRYVRLVMEYKRLLDSLDKSAL